VKGLINGKIVDFDENETILSAARRHGHFIPTLCELAEINHAPATCRVCLVDIKTGDDSEHMIATACNTPMEDGIEVLTRTPEVRKRQCLQVELLLADHNQDCASCVRHGRCELQDVAQFVGLTQTRYGRSQYYEKRSRDDSSQAIIRDMTKCIRCHRCVNVCREIQGTDVLVLAQKGLRSEIGVRDDLPLEQSECVSCGQCILVCPVGALAEKDDIEKAIDYFYDQDIFTVIQIAPATRISLGEEFHQQPGTNVEAKLITALKRLGADVVLDTNFTADLVVMEEGTELLQRIERHGKLPLLTSCSPGWVNYLEKNYPELREHLSTVKSPQQCFGSLAKTYLAEKMGVDPDKMRVVSIMPCTAKKAEASRPEFRSGNRADVDVVLTTRECARLIKREGLWLPELRDGSYDNPWMGTYSGAGEIFGATGGVMEAAIRTVYKIVTGNELPRIEFKEIRGYDHLREAQVDLGGDVGNIKVAVAHGLRSARRIIEMIELGESDYAFVEIMACQGGCMGGGGQPRRRKSYQTHWQARQKAIYRIDRESSIRQAHNNPMIQSLYRDFLGKPCGKKSHELLHTSYRNRQHKVRHTIKQIWEEIKL
jgi:ferredoxin hydrogenase gamma subunit